MELVKKSIHTEKIKAKAQLQIPLEEDMNVSDTRPDVAKLVFTRGKLKIDEIKTGTNKVWVKGRLLYHILYQAEGKEAELASMEGEIPFTEEIYLDEVDSQDRAVCHAQLEDLRFHIINSRKLNVQAVITLSPHIEETQEEEICTALSLQPQNDKQQFEYRKKPLDYLETSVCKRDLFRLHEETRLPAGMPNIGTVLWKSASVNHVTFRPLEEKVAVVGELLLFLMYIEESSDKVNWYETAIPFSGNVECQGSKETMIADIAYEIGHEEISIKEDADAEARTIGVEMALELEMKLLSRETTAIVADVYGVTCEVEAVTSPKQFKRLQQELYIEEKIADTLKLDAGNPKVLQICHHDAGLTVEECTIQDEELRIKANLNLRVLYRTGEEENGYLTVEETYPLQMVRQISGAKNSAYSQEACSVHARLEQFHIAIKEGDVLEWRAVAALQILLFDTQQEDILTQLKVEELDSRKLEKLPGFAIHFAKEGDSLWQIGKKYYVSVDKIKEVNQLTGEELHAGDRLLIVKSGEIT